MTAKAIDNEDAVGTSPAISITVKKPNVIPTAAITSPAVGTIFTEPAAVAITATAADSDGSIKRVEFYNGINLIGTDTSPPYEINWQNIIEGTYLLSAKAIDNEDASGTSEQIAIIVKKPAQQLLSCGGQEPEVKEGTIKGLSQYLSGTAQVTSWTYSPAADLTTSCLWRCDANLSYVKDENSCKLKDVFHINDLRVDQSNKDIKVTNILNNEILFILNNVTTSEIDLKNITLIANNLSESRTYLIVSNLTLPENKTKTLYVKKRDANSNALCINDRADLKNKDEILANCEKILCPRTLGGIYNCSLEGGIYIVLGLKNSGVIEDIITTSQPPPGPGGGGGGGGGSGTAEQTYVVNIEQLQKGAARELAINDKIKFDAFGNSALYLATLLEVRENSAVVKLSKIDGTEIMRMEILLKEQKKVNLDSDNYYDLIIRVENVSVSSNKANLTLMYMKEEIIITREEEQKGGVASEPEINETHTIGGITKEEGNKISVYLIWAGVILALVGVILSIYKIIMLKKMQGLSYRDLKRAKKKADEVESI